MKAVGRSRPARRTETTRIRLLTHPGRTAAVFALVLAAALAVPVAAMWGVRTIASSKTGRVTVAVPGDDKVVRVLPATPGALLVQVDDEGVVAGLTVLALNPDGRGGTAVVVPAATVATRSDGTVARVGDAYADGGLAGEADAVAALLGVSFTATAEVDRAGLARLLVPYAPFTVTLKDRVVDTVDGNDETVASPGSRDLSAADAAAVLMARKDGESELARLPRTVEVWKAVIGDRAGAPTVTGAPAASPVPGDLPGFMAGLAGGPATVQTLAATPRSCRPDDELLDVRPSAVHLLMAQVLPGAVSPADDEARVQLVEPQPDANARSLAADRVDALGAHLVLATSGGVGGAPPRTRLDYGTPAGEAAARRLAADQSLGPADVVAVKDPVEGIDLTVTLGQAFAPIVAQHRPATSSTVASSRPVCPNQNTNGGDSKGDGS